MPSITNNSQQLKSQAEFHAAVERAICKGFDAVLGLEAAGLSPLVADGRGEDCIILKAQDTNIKPTCIWRASKDTFLRALEGDRALEGAFMSARLHVSGDMSVMARIQLESIT